MGALFQRFRPAVVPEPPLRDELLSIERLEERAKSLAARFTVAPLRQRVNRDSSSRQGPNGSSTTSTW